jgi:hypothetical protein
LTSESSIQLKCWRKRKERRREVIKLGKRRSSWIRSSQSIGERSLVKNLGIEFHLTSVAKYNYFVTK